MTQNKIHPVISHLQKRAGSSAPFNDGRKIALILPGGLMTGVNGAGAMIALERMGLSQSFDVIYTASAGFANASYLLTENSEEGASIYYEDLAGKKFINFLRFWNPILFDRVVYSIRNEKPLNHKKIFDIKTDFCVRVRNKDQEQQYIKVNDFNESEYFNILKASISFPFITQGGIISGQPYYDGGLITSQVCKAYLKMADLEKCTDVLIIYNRFSQGLHGMLLNDRICEIYPRGFSADISLFETRSLILKNACRAMTKNVLRDLGN